MLISVDVRARAAIFVLTAKGLFASGPLLPGLLEETSYIFREIPMFDELKHALFIHNLVPKLNSLFRLEDMNNVLPALKQILINSSSLSNSEIRACYSQIEGLVADALLESGQWLNFSHYQQLHDILIEILHIGASDKKWKPLLKQLKEPALARLRFELNHCTNLKQLEELLDILQIPQNLLRLERKNILHAYGDTGSYKIALLLLAEKAVALPVDISDPASGKILNNILEAMLNISFIFSKPPKAWHKAVDNLTDKIQQLHADLTPSHNQFPSQPCP